MWTDELTSFMKLQANANASPSCTASERLNSKVSPFCFSAFHFIFNAGLFSIQGANGEDASTRSTCSVGLWISCGGRVRWEMPAGGFQRPTGCDVTKVVLKQHKAWKSCCCAGAAGPAAVLQTIQKLPLSAPSYQLIHFLFPPLWLLIYS